MMKGVRVEGLFLTQNDKESQKERLPQLRHTPHSTTQHITTRITVHHIISWRHPSLDKSRQNSQQVFTSEETTVNGVFDDLTLLTNIPYQPVDQYSPSRSMGRSAMCDHE